MSVIISRDEVREPLYVVVPLYNPWRWHSRYKHTERAVKHFIESGAVVILVEVAFNRREFAMDHVGNAIHGQLANCNIHDPKFKHQYIQLRTKDELWLKENMIGIGVSHLPYDWEQVAWLDSDIHFLRPNWVGETIQQLQHYKFVQMFSQAQDLSPTYEALPADYPHATGISWTKAWQEDILETAANLPGHPVAYPTKRVWPGLAWACTRQAWDDVGGLMDFMIWGGCDYTTAHCLIEKRENMMNTNLHANYQTLVNEWYNRCVRYIRRNVGTVDGLVTHHWHGRKTERGYGIKHRVLAKNGFNPLQHLKKDHQGLYQWNDLGDEAFIQLRDSMRAISALRDEDSTYTGLEEDSQGH